MFRLSPFGVSRYCMFRLGFALPAAMAVWLLCAPAIADPLISKSFSYFSVGGRTAEELDKALSARGPLMSSTGTRHPGATRIKFGGSIRYAERNGLCSVASARVTLNTTIILPRWTQRKRASRDLALIWDTLSSDIKRHEERHAEIARSHARMLEKTLLSLRPKADCKDLKAATDTASRDAMEAHNKDQARFDRNEAASFDRRMVRLLTYRLKDIDRSKAAQ